MLKYLQQPLGAVLVLLLLEELLGVVSSIEEVVSWLAQNLNDAGYLKSEYRDLHEQASHIESLFGFGNLSGKYVRSCAVRSVIFGYLPAGIHSVP